MPEKDMTYQHMCEVIAQGWTELGFQGREWTGEEVWEFDPNGELFWIPEQYAKSVMFLAQRGLLS